MTLRAWKLFLYAGFASSRKFTGETFTFCNSKVGTSLTPVLKVKTVKFSSNYSTKPNGGGRRTMHTLTDVVHQEGTVFSLSSGHGKCGVAVVRVSGPRVKKLLMSVTDSKCLPKPRTAVLKRLINPDTHEAVDRGLVLWFPKPHSFTGEDCAEFQVHGGPAVISSLLACLHSMPGCRQAEPGEFTKRAFMNGKLDLTAVEGLGDLIHAETEAQRKQALRQMEGELSQLYYHWRSRLLKCVADIEAHIDFSEDQNIEDGILDNVLHEVGRLKEEIRCHLDDNRQGERLREGVHVAIVGEPNVGKSSLLNAICQRPAAIVTPIAGTTRDVIETAVNIGGYPVLLSDTAGLRHTEDVVEIEGVKRAIARAQQADIRVLVVDGTSRDLMLLSNMNWRTMVARQMKTLGIIGKQGAVMNANSEKEIREMERNQRNNQSDMLEKETRSESVIKYSSSMAGNHSRGASVTSHNADDRSDVVEVTDHHTRHRSIAQSGFCDYTNNDNSDPDYGDSGVFPLRDVIVVLNKCDLVPSVDLEVFRIPEEEQTEGGNARCAVSCLTGEGLTDFLNLLKEKVAQLCGDPLTGHPSITQARHRAHLTSCVRLLTTFADCMADDDTVLAAQALRGVLREIGNITGKITSEDILDVIFRDFCIGK